MKILIICPLWFPISNDAPGGIETFLSQLIEELNNLNCEVTAITSGDSSLPCKILPVISKNIYKKMDTGTAFDYNYYEQHQLWLAIERLTEFDIIHSHIGCGAYILSSMPGLQNRVLHTIHTPIYRDMEWFVNRHPNIWFSTVSEFMGQKLKNEGVNECHIIYNGIKVDKFNFRLNEGRSLFFIGRIEWNKGPDLAIKTSLALGRPLILAGPIVDKNFFVKSIEPFLNKYIQYIGVVDYQTKNELFTQAGCALLPFRGQESFGMVAIEAMACGTPVVAMANGALPEIIEPNLTGYIARDESELPSLVEKAFKLDRALIRIQCKSRFDIAIIARQYFQLYEHMLNITSSLYFKGN